MPETRAAAWTRLLRARSEARGITLSDEVVEELGAYLADLYDATREQGGSDREAMDVVRQAIDRGAYDEIASTRRAHTPGSRLLPRAAPPDGRRGGSLWIADLLFDLRYAARAMRRRPAFHAAIIVILAVGVGAALAATAVLETVLWRPLPYPQSDALVVLTHGAAPDEGRSFSPADWRDYAARRQSLAGLAAWAAWPMNLSGGGEPERLRSVIVSGEFFQVVGVPPALGRVPTVQDDRPSAPAVAVLSDGFWRRRFGAQPAVIGQTILLNGQTVTIVGVMPPAFALPDPQADLWMPMGLSPQVLNDRAGEWLSLIGRLQPQVTTEAARADLSVTAGQLAAAWPRPNRDTQIRVVPLLEEVVGGVRRPLWLGGLAVLFVFLAGLANAANLMLAGATTRQDEMAIRAGLGANANRLARQLLTESLVLAGIGSALGVLVSDAFLRAFMVLADGRVPRADQLALDARTSAIAIGLCLLSGAVIGGAGAWHLVRAGTHALLHGSPQRLVRSVAAQELFLALQVAFALTLITGATDVARSYRATLQVDPGFDTSSTQTIQLTLPRRRYPDNAAHLRFATRAMEALAAQPGVTSVGVVSDLPFVANATHFPVVRQGQAPDSARMTTVRLADPGFFRTLRVPLVAGRFFDGTDRPDGPAVALLNASAARVYGGASAVMENRLVVSGEDDRGRTIIGVVGDIKHAGLHADEGPVLYIPYAQKPFAFLNWMGMVVRTVGPALPAASLKAAMAGVDPDQPAEAILSMDDYRWRETAPYRLGSLVIGSLAGTAFLLALAGIHGVTVFIIGRRAREIALRLALGASTASILRQVVSRLGAVLAAGVAVGVAGSVLTAHLLRAAFPDTAAIDAGAPGTLVLACILIGTCAAVIAVRQPLRLVRHLHRDGLHLDQHEA